jgi:hypothetical protein
MLTTQVPGSLFTSSNSTPSLLIYMTFYSFTPFVDLRLLIHAPDLYCQIMFPFVISFPSGIFQEFCVTPFTFDFLLPVPFYLLSDFNLLPDEAPFVFDFSDLYALTSFFTQDTRSATADFLQIQMYNFNVTLAHNLHPTRRSAKARRTSRHS